MFAYRKYRVPISLTAEQRSEIRRLADGQRHAYNWAVARLKSGYGGSIYDMQKQLTAYRHTADWLRAVPAAVQRAGITDAFTALKLSTKFGRGRVKYRSKRHRPSMKCPLAPRVEDRYTLWLPRFGTIRANIPNELMEHEPRAYEFVPHRNGYLLYASCRVKLPQPWNNPVVKGIDRGTVEPTVVATLNPDGAIKSKDSYDTASTFKQSRAAYQKLQSKMSKMNRHSNRHRRLHAKLRRRLQKVRNQRTYAECVAAKHVVDDYDPGAIVMEDLKLGAMTRRGRGKRGLNRELRFVRHHAVEQRIKNRAELRGVRVTTVDPGYTSQTCARCGHIDKDSRITRDMFKCTKCSYVQQADINAAIIIGRQGLPRPDKEAFAAPPTEAGMPFVRRQLDPRLNCFTEGAIGGTKAKYQRIPLPTAARRKTSELRRSHS